MDLPLQDLEFYKLAVCHQCSDNLRIQYQHHSSQTNQEKNMQNTRCIYQQCINTDILVFDIPLLFETGGNKNMDAVACVSVPSDIQRSRVLARGTMTEDQFRQILAKQMPASEKCAQSDYVIVTDTIDHAREQVRAVIQDIKSRL